MGVLTTEEDQLRGQLKSTSANRQNAPLSFSQKGSAGAFRARAEQKRFNEANKLRRESRDLQKKLVENTNNITTLVAANL